MNLLKTEALLAIRKIFLKLSFLLLNIILYFLTLLNTWQFHVLNWQGVGPVWAISFSLHWITFLGIPTVAQA